jgi:CubicO group peptidase (beta-lactamase class C family)
MAIPRRVGGIGALALCVASPTVGMEPSHEDLLQRAQALELHSPSIPPPGDEREHYAAGFAQIMCSAVFVTGLDQDFAAENVGYFTAPYAMRARLGKPVVDRAGKTVTVAVPGGIAREAKFIGSQGCVTFPLGSHRLYFEPHQIAPHLPDSEAQAWPLGDNKGGDQGDKLADVPLRTPAIDATQVKDAMDAAFASPAGMTAAVVVTWRGQLIAERYAEGITARTPLESWSMGKSVTAALMGVLIERGVYRLDEPAPIPEWQHPGDPRAAIRIEDLMHMSSGLRIRSPYDPDFDPSGPYPEHFYLYTGAINSFHYAATRPQQWPPDTVGRYRNTDPVLVNYLIRLGVEKHGGNYWEFPQRALFDRIGVRTMVIETDPHGNFLTQGYDLASARDWARIGNLFLADGMWNGKRILPKGYAKFVSTVAPAWVADGRPVYGGFFWINGDEALPIPKEAYYMAGAGGQFTVIIPSHDLVVVRLGHYKGDIIGTRDFGRALSLLLEAIPRNG